jgi:hypothetical protein
MAEGQYRFALRVTHSLRPNYIGPEPEAPVASSPRIVSYLVSSRDCDAMAGTDTLAAVPERLRVGMGRSFADRLSDKNRCCPLVYVARDSISGESRVDTRRLARLLAGTAIVVVADSTELDRELESTIESNAYRCFNGAVRVYWPGVNVECESEGRRHRFYTKAKIEQLGPVVVEDEIVKALARRSLVPVPVPIWSVDDVLARQREHRLAELREQGGQQNQVEMLKLFEETNSALTETLRESEQAFDELRAHHERDESEHEHALRAAQFQRDAAQAELREKSDALDRVNNARKQFAVLPTELPEMLEWLEGLYGDKVVFTEAAKKSAKAAAIGDVRAELPQVWKLLWSVPNVLHGLLFDGAKSGSLPKAFHNSTGFELAMSEGSTTNKDRKLARQRVVDYHGSSLDMSPHIKYGDAPPRCLRVHFAPYREGEQQIVVVGHCGDHQETAGTRRRK